LGKIKSPIAVEGGVVGLLVDAVCDIGQASFIIIFFEFFCSSIKELLHFHYNNTV
jgi:hypothetical protein